MRRWLLLVAMLAGLTVALDAALPATETCGAAYPSASWTVTTGTPNDDGTGVCTGTSGGFNLAFWNADVFPNDQYSQSTWVGGIQYWVVSTRLSGSGVTTDGYYTAGNGLQYLTVSEITDGVFSDIANRNVASWTTNDVIRMESVGTSHTVKVNGVGVTDLIGIVDASIVSGSPGAGTYDADANWDNWEGGSLVVASGCGRRLLLGVGC